MTAHPLLPRDGSVVMFMIVRRPDGGPTGYPMTGVFRGGELEISTYRKAAKARYLLADDRVCCVVPDPHRPGRGVAVYGRAEPVDSAAFTSGMSSGDGGPMHVPDEVRETVRDRLASSKRMVFRIGVERLRELGSGDVAP